MLDHDWLENKDICYPLELGKITNTNASHKLQSNEAFISGQKPDILIEAST